MGHPVDRARQVVFQQLLRTRIEGRHQLLAVAGHNHQAEVDHRTHDPQLLAPDTVLLRPLFRVAVRLGVILLNLDLAAGGLAVFLEQVHDLVGVALELHRYGRIAAAEEQLQCDLAVKLLQHMA